MIEDMDAAVLFLRDVTMKVMREIRDDHKYRRKVEIKRGEDGKLVMYLFLRDQEADLVESIAKFWEEIDDKHSSRASSTSFDASGRRNESIFHRYSSVVENKSSMREMEFDDLLVEEEITTVNLVSVFMNQASMSGSLWLETSDTRVWTCKWCATRKV